MQLSFTTEKFKITKEETEKTGKFKFGKELSNFLEKELSEVKCLFGDDKKYNSIEIIQENDYGWNVTINTDMCKVRLELFSSFKDLILNEDGIPEDVTKIIWTIKPELVFSWCDYRVYLDKLKGTNIINSFYSNVSIDLENIIKKENLNLTRII